MVEVFKPSEKALKLYVVYLLVGLAPLVVFGSVASWVVYVNAPGLLPVVLAVIFAPLTAAALLYVYWAFNYVKSLVYELGDEEVVVRRGVWWKMVHTVPYSRVMSVDVVQGPISRFLGIASVDVHTAGYTGYAGGAAGPGTRRAEASMLHVDNAGELREKVLARVRGRRLFETGDLGAEMLEELRTIRRLLSRP
ncbi:MAG: PH domain-containing protein [Candidatus Caldarchaeum sp.]|nr:PH domain-containing protein [Candidatus Caldarchaeum sp.]MCS7137981.1 PH domain-containing protein [Candidatus Caldarchaeum sp.]MDW7977976.1 PH domain-containing protein [Candidatus Caldarchaeum sp.]MDW8358953.1 PH domain-containing protein [Candidatus Caldarchaeum sp.]